MQKKKVLIIGAGISGLSIAVDLKYKGFDVVVLEKKSQAGGVISTFSKNGFKAESGSNSVMIQSQKSLDFFSKIGLDKDLLIANTSAKKRFFTRYRKAQEVPMSPMSLIKSKLFTLKGKLRLVCEPFIKTELPEDMSVSDFTRARLGQEALDYAMNPFMAGIYAGNPDELSIKHAFPPFWNLVKKYGSIIKGASKLRKEKEMAGNIFKPMMISFKDGMASLPEKLAEILGDDLKLNAELISIDNGWKVAWSANGEEVFDEYDILVLAVNAKDLSSLPLSGALADSIKPLDEISYAPMTTMTLGFRNSAIPQKLEGFGVLTSQKDKFNILGSLFSSSIFENRSPANCSTITNYLGGMRNPHLINFSEDELLDMVMNDLDKLLNINEKPIFMKSTKWKHAIPQYKVGYDEILEIVSQTHKDFQNLKLIGSYIGGVGVSSCIDNALLASEDLSIKFR